MMLTKDIFSIQFSFLSTSILASICYAGFSR